MEFTLILSVFQLCGVLPASWEPLVLRTQERCRNLLYGA